MIDIPSKYLIIIVISLILYLTTKKDIEHMTCLISLNDLDRYVYRNFISQKLKSIDLTDDQITTVYNGLFEKRKKNKRL